MQKISIDLLPNENSVLQVNIVVYKITGFPAYIARSHSSLVDGRLADQVVLGSKPKHAIFFSSNKKDMIRFLFKVLLHSLISYNCFFY